MPSMINVGVLNVNSPQQNAGIFFGELNMTGWDANQKMVQAEGGQFGIFMLNMGIVNNNFDGFELMDGNMLDQDLKAQVSGNL